MKLLMVLVALTSSASMAMAQESTWQVVEQYQQPFIGEVIQHQPFVESTQQVVQPKSYKDAYKDAQAGDKPLLILVTADWCPPCQRMKQTTIPQLMQKNAFKDFHYATVDYDVEKGLAKQLIGDRGIPQIIMFEKQEGQWIRRYLKGIQTPQTVEAFFAQANTFRTADANQEAGGTVEK